MYIGSRPRAWPRWVSASLPPSSKARSSPPRLIGCIKAVATVALLPYRSSKPTPSPASVAPADPPSAHPHTGLSTCLFFSEGTLISLSLREENRPGLPLAVDVQIKVSVGGTRFVVVGSMKI
ncbi:hypothetical protein VPH35_138794 [Triticum aestivum]